jgi:hypothetical protein
MESPWDLRRNEEQRFRDAFLQELWADPNRAPSPLSLSYRMGLAYRNKLNGRLTKLRTKLLKENGFRKDEYSGRWVK